MLLNPSSETIRFYDVGYEDGFQHGQIHGRIEGRELGRQKGFEMWEELGLYEGFAMLWKVANENGESNDGYLLVVLSLIQSKTN